jgi:hypothetical protein
MGQHAVCAITFYESHRQSSSRLAAANISAELAEDSVIHMIFTP